MTIRVFVIVGLLYCLGCEKQLPNNAAKQENHPTAKTQSADLLPEIPPFPLETLEPTVRAQVEEAINAVDTDPSNASTNGRLGMLFHTYDIYRQAEVCYRRALMFNDSDTRWQYYHGLVLVNLGEWVQARRALSPFVEQNPDYVPARLELADIDFRQNRYEEAKRFYEDVLSRSPRTSAALVGLARCQLQAGEIEMAVATLTSALEITPQYGQARYILAQALRKMGRKEKAIEQARLAEQQRDIKPPIDDPLREELDALATGAIEALHRGIRLMQADKVREALPMLEESLRLNPDLPETHTQLGTAYLLLRQFELAEKHLNTALKQSLANVQARYNLGLLAHRKQQWSAAVEHFRAVCEIEPTHFDANLGLGTDLQKLNRHTDAIAPFQAAIRSNPTDARAYKRLADSLMHLEFYAEALRILELGQRELPADGSITDRLAWLLAVCPKEAIRDPERAITLAKKVCDRTKWRVPQPIDTLAAAYAASGDFENALETIKKAVQVAQGAKKQALANEIQGRLSLYEKGEQYLFQPHGANN